LINVASGSLLTVLVLYLILHQGTWYVDKPGCFLQGDVRTKVKTPGAGKNMVGEALQAPTMRGSARSIISQSRVYAWSPTEGRRKGVGEVQETLILYSG
jgi:hypothetical protein